MLGKFIYKLLPPSRLGPFGSQRAVSAMSSSVFFKFKSQKEPSRVTFDGTGISVFELKREIITMSRLGDGTDFELIIYSDDSNEGE